VPYDDIAVVAQITAAERNLDAPEEAPDFVLRGTFIDSRDIGDYATGKVPGA
jgi:hypothetical protein